MKFARFVYTIYSELPGKAWMLAAFMLSQVCVALSPLIMGDTLNALADHADTRRLVVLLLAMFGLSFVGQALLSSMQHTLFRSVRAFEKNVRLRVWTKLNTIPIARLDHYQGGVLMSKLFHDVMVVANSTRMVTQGVIGALLVTAVSFTIAVIRSPEVALALTIVVPMCLLAFITMRSRIRRENHRFRRSAEALAGLLMGLVELVPVLRLMAVHREYTGLVDREATQYKEVAVRLDKTNWLFEVNVSVLFELSQYTVLVLGVVLCFRHRIQVGDVAMVFMLFSQTLGRVVELVRVGPHIEQVLESLASLRELLDTPDEAQPTEAVYLPAIRTIEVDSVAFRYAEDQQEVFANISFRVSRGEVLGIAGECGAGKSTLIKLMLGQYVPEQGSVLVNGHPLRRVDERQFRRHVGVVPQQILLHPGTLRNNVTLLQPEVRDAEILRAFDMVRLTDFVTSRPGGLNAPITRGTELSGGERQKLGIARALLRDPDLLILDEISNNLDAASKNDIIRAIQNIASDRIVVVISHDEQVLSLANRVVRLKGRQGDPVREARVRRSEPRQHAEP